jgi:uncharacterized protein YbcI
MPVLQQEAFFNGQVEANAFTDGTHRTESMDTLELTMAQRVAQAASTFQQRQTGHVPTAVTVVLSGDTLVITLHEALTPAEKALARSPVGAAQVQEFHKQLFASSSESLRQEIKRITGVDVREAAAEVETTTGTVVYAFASGNLVQVFQLVHGIPAGSWDGTAEGPCRDGQQKADPGTRGAK